MDYEFWLGTGHSLSAIGAFGVGRTKRPVWLVVMICGFALSFIVTKMH